MNIGERDSSPFVHFVAGCSVFPPNTLLTDASTILDQLSTDPSASFFEELIKWGTICGEFSVLQESTWYGYLCEFLLRHSDISTLESRIQILRFCSNPDVEAAWKDLNFYL